MTQCDDCGATLPSHKAGCHDGRSDGLVYRLRREGENAMRQHLSMGMHKLCAEAADEIDRLTKLIHDGCVVFEHYDLPEHAFHYRRELHKRSRDGEN